MYQEAFVKLSSMEVKALLDVLNPDFDGVVFSPSETLVVAQNLSFYPGCRLLDITEYAGVPVKRRFVISSPHKNTVLNFSNEVIYEMNRSIPLLLQEETVLEYVKFFFSYVRGQYGRFLIVETVDDMNWKDNPPPSARKSIGKMLCPVCLEKKDYKGSFYLKTTMVFKDSLFKTGIKIEPSGYISLFGEELLIEDMPLLDDVFGQ